MFHPSSFHGVQQPCRPPVTDTAVSTLCASNTSWGPVRHESSFLVYHCWNPALAQCPTASLACPVLALPAALWKDKIGFVQSLPRSGAAWASDLAFLHYTVPQLTEPLLSSAAPASGADPRVTPQQAGTSLALPRTFLGPFLPISPLPLYIHSLCYSTQQRHRNFSLFLWGAGFISEENIII